VVILALRRTKQSHGGLHMRNSIVAAFGVGIIAALSASSAAEAAIVSFGFGAFDGSVDYVGTSLDASSEIDLDMATLLVMEVDPGDSSGLAVVDPVKISADTSPPSAIINYGSASGPVVDEPLGAVFTLSWPIGPSADMFTETLTTVESIDRSTPNQINVTMTGTLTDTKGLFSDAPAVLTLHATQDLGSEFPLVTFQNTAGLSPSIPEPSTWVMMTLGFVALGYTASRQRKANGALLSI
jgi:hypothetical protein